MNNMRCFLVCRFYRDVIHPGIDLDPSWIIIANDEEEAVGKWIKRHYSELYAFGAARDEFYDKYAIQEYVPIQ